MSAAESSGSSNNVNMNNNDENVGGDTAAAPPQPQAPPAAAAAAAAPPPQPPQHPQPPPQHPQQPRLAVVAGGAAAPLGESPAGYLQAIAQLPAGTDSLMHLSESQVTSAILQQLQPQQQQHHQGHVVAASYLVAVAKHLPAAVSVMVNRTGGGLLEGTAAFLRTGNRAAAAAAMEMDHPLQQHVSAILSTVGAVVVQCPPHLIGQSGILPALANYMRSANTQTAAASDPQQQPQLQVLTAAHTEFVQAAVHARQYRYAERILGDLWPRPTAAWPVTVRHVLRYFYWRGVLHMNCQDNYTMAIRCFWTVLSVPADAVAPTAVAAWKKLVLVRCLDGVDQLGGIGREGALNRAPLTLPKAAPTCLCRLVSSATEAVQKAASAGETTTAAAAAAASSEASSSGIGRGMFAPELVAAVSRQEQPYGLGGDHHHHAAPELAAALEPPRPGGGNEAADGKSQNMQVYVQLVQAFWAVDRVAFDRIVSATKDTVLIPDGNYEFISQQLQAALLRRHLIQLSSIYAVLPLDQLVDELVLLPARQRQQQQQQQQPDPAAAVADKAAAVAVVQKLILQVSADLAWPLDIVVQPRPAATTTTNGNAQQQPQPPQEPLTVVVFPPRPSPLLNTTSALQQEEQIVQLTHMIRSLDVSIASSHKYTTLQKRKDNKSGGGGTAGGSGVSRATAAAVAAVESSLMGGGPRGVEDI